jgi:hypothetical protein
MRTWTKWCFAIAGVVSLFYFVCVYPALEGEERTHATIITILLVQQYAKEHAGQWPGSWDDLRQTCVRDWSNFSWPRDYERIRSRVMIDFAATPTEIVGANSERFEFIKPKGGYYPIYADFVRSLQTTVRDSSVHNRSEKKNN